MLSKSQTINACEGAPVLSKASVLLRSRQTGKSKTVTFELPFRKCWTSLIEVTRDHFPYIYWDASGEKWIWEDDF